MADKPDYFQTALSNFATDAAYGGSVRHLTDIGYTLNQIMDRLDYPAPRSKVQKLMTEHLYDTKVLLREEPSEAVFAQKDVYVQEQDSYGRRSMRKINADLNSQSKTTEMAAMTGLSKNSKIKEFFWRETIYIPHAGEKVTKVLHQKCEENGEQYSYVECRFSNLNGQQDRFAEIEEIQCLNNRQREYLAGIMWEAPVLYHRLDHRMIEIIAKLYEAGKYSGSCYFLTAKEKLVLGVLPHGNQFLPGRMY